MREGKRPILLAVPCRLPFDLGDHWTGHQSVIVYAWRPLSKIHHTLNTHYKARPLARQLVSKGNIWSLRKELEQCVFVNPSEPPVVHQSMDDLLTYYRQNIQEPDSALLIFRMRKWQVYTIPEIKPEEPPASEPIASRKRQRIKSKVFSGKVFSTSN